MLIILEDNRKQNFSIKKLAVLGAFTVAVGLIGKSLAVSWANAATPEKESQEIQVISGATCYVKLDEEGMVKAASVKNDRGQLMYKFRDPDNVIGALLNQQNEGMAAIPRPTSKGGTRFENDGEFVVNMDDGVCSLDVSRGAIQVAIAPEL
ncbi:MAG: hypothetical protein RBR86_09110 [Pseudobdellovibrionaceae bacterium]|jgi:hypothetical protein|nr:hypothetical protein [Pseudobdellovibrionaceae bacterium]